MGRELSRPAPRQPDLGALGGDIGRAPGRGKIDDLRVDLDDAPPPTLSHSGNDGATEQDRALDEEIQLLEVILPADLLERRFRLRSGRVQDEHRHRSQLQVDRPYELPDLRLLGHVRGEGLGDSPLLPDLRGNSVCVPIRRAAVDGNCEPVAGKPQRDVPAETA